MRLNFFSIAPLLVNGLNFQLFKHNQTILEDQ